MGRLACLLILLSAPAHALAPMLPVLPGLPVVGPHPAPPDCAATAAPCAPDRA